MTLFFHKRAVFPMSSAHIYHHVCHFTFLHNVASLIDCYDSFMWVWVLHIVSRA